MKILFVCRANVGRSQIGEAVFKKLAGGEHDVSSAGTRVHDDEGMRLIDLDGAQEVINTLGKIGVPAGDNVRNQITPEMVEAADRIIVMAEPETIPDFLKNSPKMIYWEVPDAKGLNQEDTNKIRDHITERVKDFMQTLK